MKLLRASAWANHPDDDGESPVYVELVYINDYNFQRTEQRTALTVDEAKTLVEKLNSAIKIATDHEHNGQAIPPARVE